MIHGLAYLGNIDVQDSGLQNVVICSTKTAVERACRLTWNKYSSAAFASGHSSDTVGEKPHCEGPTTCATAAVKARNARVIADLSSSVTLLEVCNVELCTAMPGVRSVGVAASALCTGTAGEWGVSDDVVSQTCHLGERK